MDLFASEQNHQTPVFCTWFPSNKAYAVDAMSISWENMFAYAHPPLCLIQKVLSHIRQYDCQIILIAPFWQRRHWFPDLLDLAIAPPLRLPQIPDLLYQPKTQIQHPNPELFKLGLAPVGKRLKEIGFSQKSRKFLLAAWRERDYSAKFRVFNSWCCSREVDPYCVSIMQVSDFLAHLFDKGLQYSTINGYRSMLSAVLPCIDGFKVGQHPYVVQMLKGVFNSRPPKTKLVPEWNLLKVLDGLQKKPFEPLNKACLKYVTLKTVFMIAITSFRRCSDLQSFRIGEGSVNIQSKGITFLRHGLAKQDRQSHRKAIVFIPAFPENKKLDPKRCLYYYLKATEKFRKSPEGSEHEERRVFLSLNEPHKPVSAQTISKWIVETLKIVLEDKNLKVKAHSTRALGPSLALFRGPSLESILNSADWSQESTFVRFYLRDLNCNVLKHV